LRVNWRKNESGLLTDLEIPKGGPMPNALYMPTLTALLAAVALTACEDRQPLERSTAPPQESPPVGVAPKETTPAETLSTPAEAPAPHDAEPATDPEPDTASPSPAPPAQIANPARQDAEPGVAATPPAEAASPPATNVSPPVPADKPAYWEPPAITEQLVDEAEHAGWQKTTDDAGNLILTPPATGR
jgi:hypothetical protein